MKKINEIDGDNNGDEENTWQLYSEPFALTEPLMN